MRASRESSRPLPFGMVVDHVGVWHIAPGCASRSDRRRRKKPTLWQSRMHRSIKFVAIARQRLVLRVGDLAGEPEAAGRVAVRAGVALNEDAVENVSSG